MITPIRTMTINEIVERKYDLLVSADDIKELARNERNKAIDDFVDYLSPILNTYHDRVKLDEIAEQLKGGVE